MKTPIRAVACMVFLALLIVAPSTFAQGSKLVGVWKITEARSVPPSDQNGQPRELKNYRPGIIIFTKSHFSWVDNHGEPLPDLQEKDPNVAYFATSFDQLTDFSGTYEVKGSSIAAQVLVSKMPSVVREGGALIFTYRFEGEVLVLSWETPKKDTVTFKLERLE